MLEDMDIETGVDLDRLIDAAAHRPGFVKGELPSKMLKAGPRWNVPASRPSEVG